MNVLFLCGSLEPGRDGVGDYSRRLAGEIIRQGQQASIIAMNDFHITTIVKDVQNDESEMIPVLRIPAILSWPERIRNAKNWVDEFNPDWLSLQYVPYAFHKKGLPFNLTNSLRLLGKGKKWHIMFHELWVGQEDGQFLKMKVLAFLQQNIINRMLKVLHPSIIHTHLPVYKKKLAQLGWNSEALPLFSNIKKIKLKESISDDAIVRVGFFSQVEAHADIIRFLIALKGNAINHNKKFEIVLLGGSKMRMLSFIDEIKDLKEEDISIRYAGFLSPGELSEQLQACTIGITPVLRHGLGKSGSVAAFLEHGVPVAVPVADRDDPPFFNEEVTATLLLKPDLDQLEIARKAVLKVEKFVNIAFIAALFLTDLSKSTNWQPLILNPK